MNVTQPADQIRNVFDDVRRNYKVERRNPRERISECDLCQIKVHLNDLGDVYRRVMLIFFTKCFIREVISIVDLSLSLSYQGPVEWAYFNPNLIGQVQVC